MIPIVCFVGPSGVGKTSLLEHIVANLKGRGLRLVAIKHTDHDFEVDRPGKDSWRLSESGCDSVVVTSPRRMVLFQKKRNETSLTEIASHFQGSVDIVLAKGYKNSRGAKIAICRSGKGNELVTNLENILAIVSDQEMPLNVPHFNFAEIDAIADCIVQYAAVGPFVAPVGVHSPVLLPY